MRKIYSLFLVMLMLPVLAMAADNLAISKAERTAATTTDYRAYVDPSILQPVVAGTAESYTIGSWVKLGALQSVSNLNNNMLIFGYGGREHCNDNGCWNLVVNSSGSMTVTGWGTQGVGGAVSNSTFSVGEWHHVMVSYDSEAPSMTFYLDGVQIDQKAMNAKHEWFTNENPAIYFAGFGFNGLLDEAQIYNRALSAEDVAKAYRNANAVDGLVGLYTFDEIAAGTTSQYANQSKQANASSLNMTWEKITGTQCWDNGIVYVISAGSVAESAPTTEEGREILPMDVTLYVMDGEGGTITVTDGENTYDGENAAEGVTINTTNELTITATPEDGYQLIGIYAVDPVSGARTEITGGTYTPTGDVIITALFTNTTHALTVANTEEIPYTITRSGEAVTDFTALLSGAEYTLTLNVPETKVLNAVRLGDEELTANNGSYTFILDADATLTIDARAKAQYTVTINQPEGGSVTVSNGSATIASGSQVYEGTTLTLSAASASGYQFINYLINGAYYASTTITPTEDITVSAVFEEGIEYCEPTPVAGARTTETTATAGRGISSLAITAGSNTANITGLGTASGRRVYQDATSTILTAEAGQTVSIVATGSGIWMNTYIYADFDLNGFTTEDKVFGNYTGSMNNYAGTYTFTIPADQASGTYRVRYKVDWDDQDPCLYGQSGNDNGEVVIDFNIIIPKQVLAAERTVTVETENEAYGTVAITSPATEGNTVTTDEKTVTVKATPVEGMAFVNWTNSANEVVATTATYNYTGENDETLTAHFGYSVDYTVSTGGNAVFIANGLSFNTGAAFAIGTEVTITMTPQGAKTAILTINGSTVEFEGNTYSFTIENANVVIAVDFVDKVNRLNIITTGKGSVEMWQAADESNLNLPSGAQIQNGAAIPATDETGYDNYVIFFIPEEGESLVSVSYTIGSLTKDLDLDNDLFPMDSSFGESYKSDDTRVLEVPKADINDNFTITAVFTGDSQGIDEIGIDEANGPVEYYNLQGVRVASENLVPGFYIVRQGSKTAKVFIRK